jgi:hypothetical protein
LLDEEVCSMLSNGASGKFSATSAFCDLATGPAKIKTRATNTAGNHRFKANRLPQSCA